MSNQDTNKNLSATVYLSLLSLSALFIIVISAMKIFEENLDIGFVGFSLIIIFFSPNLRVKIPRTDIHLSFAEILIFYALLVYGASAAVLIAGTECLYSSFVLRRKKVEIKNKTILFNSAISVLTTYLTALTIRLIFSSKSGVLREETTTEFIEILICVGIGQFLYNSFGIAIWAALKTEKPFEKLWKYWFDYCTSVLVIFIANALIAGLIIKGQELFNTTLFLLALIVSAVVFFTYRQYMNDLEQTSARAEQSERERAEQAETHIEELQHHIAEQNRISNALRESKEKFRHAAFHDTLTDLPNRNLFMETLKFALEKTKQKGDFKFAVLFLDINRFKTINDSLGHSMGDRLILHVAKRLTTAIRENDLVARFGGDEFAFILNKVSDIGDAVKFAERIKEKISAPFSLSGRQIFTSFSIGIAMGSSEYEAAEDVLRDADIAMYHAKDTKKDYVVFDKNMHARAVTLHQIETDLRLAIERDELCMYYQPIIELDSMKLSGFESLVRWNHPRRGLVPPSEFIPVSEETGLIVPMTLWILRSSCQQMVEWQRKYPNTKNLVVSVNLSGKHFAQKNLVEQIKSILDETRINPANLKLELTESAVMENAESVISMLREIRKLGIHLSIDDFGTGYSSLSYLHRFPINTLKVDRSFVGTMEEGSENGEIVNTIISLAKTLNLNVVAEGIETIHQLHQLRVLGCEYGQGYLFSRPVPAEEAEKVLDDQTRWQNIIPKKPRMIPSQNAEVSHLRLAK